MAKDAVLGGNKGVSLEVSPEFTNGNKTESVAVELRSGHNMKAEKIENITKNELSPLLLFVAILGWLLPTPGQMYRELKSGISFLLGRRNGK